MKQGHTVCVTLAATLGAIQRLALLTADVKLAIQEGWDGRVPNNSSFMVVILNTTINENDKSPINCYRDLWLSMASMDGMRIGHSEWMNFQLQHLKATQKDPTQQNKYLIDIGYGSASSMHHKKTPMVSSKLSYCHKIHEIPNLPWSTGSAISME